MQLIATFNNDALSRFSTRVAGLANAAPVMASALNAAGEALRHHTVIAETGQTGLGGDVIERAQNAREASPARLVFSIAARGGSVRLKYFGAKEGGGGVSAHPWGRETFFPGAFITSGRNGNRKPALKLNGQVYTNIRGGRWRGKIKLLRSGLFIPTELTRGATAAAFEAQAPAALAAVLTRVAGLLQ